MTTKALEEQRKRVSSRQGDISLIKIYLCRVKTSKKFHLFQEGMKAHVISDQKGLESPICQRGECRERNEKEKKLHLSI